MRCVSRGAEWLRVGLQWKKKSVVRRGRSWARKSPEIQDCDSCRGGPAAQAGAGGTLPVAVQRSTVRALSDWDIGE